MFIKGGWFPNRFPLRSHIYRDARYHASVRRNP
jgi:hypothetical protein